MPIKITMPALSPTMTEGTLARWVKKEGDAIKSGDVIAEIETDKATMEFEAVDEGVLGKIIVGEGTEGVAVNTLIGWILEEGESASAIPADGVAAPAASAAVVPTAAASAAAPAAAPIAAPVSVGRSSASPLAKRIAQQAGLNLNTIKGTGPNGRIVRADVDAALAAKPAAAEASAAPAAVAAPVAAPKPAEAPKPAAPVASGPDAKALADLYGIPYTEQPNNGMRKTIARRLTESKQTVPHFYLTVDCEIDALLGLRKQLNERHDLKVSVNDYIIKAVALALKKVPEANASWTDKAVLLYSRVDISVAVATPGGLITPIIKDASNKGLSTISGEMKDLATRARDNKLKPEEFQGGTFSISNLGMFGVKQFEAIVNPPQGCILAVGAGEQRPIVKNGALSVGTVMTVTLSVDHRVVDGAVGAQFLKAFKAYIEDPTSMLL